MKVYPLLRKTIIMLVASVILVGGLVFLMFINNFLTFPWDWKPWLIIGVWGVSGIALIIITPLNIYYEVNKKYVEVTKYGKKNIYNYSDVVYIDEEQSEKKKVVCFYTNKGHCRYITFDRKGLLYKTMLANCKNRISKEEFQINYPNVKL